MSAATVNWPAGFRLADIQKPQGQSRLWRVLGSIAARRSPSTKSAVLRLGRKLRRCCRAAKHPTALCIFPRVTPPAVVALTLRRIARLHRIGCQFQVQSMPFAELSSQCRSPWCCRADSPSASIPPRQATADDAATDTKPGRVFPLAPQGRALPEPCFPAKSRADVTADVDHLNPKRKDAQV